MLRRQAVTSLQHGFLRSVENVYIYNLVTPNGVWENVFLYNIDTYFYYDCLADVMPYCVIGRCFLAWQMLFAFLECGRCYCQEEDVILLFFVIGRCYCHILLWKMSYHLLHYVTTHCIG